MVPSCIVGVVGDGGILSGAGGTKVRRCRESEAGKEASIKRAEGIACVDVTTIGMIASGISLERVSSRGEMLRCIGCSGVPVDAIQLLAEQIVCRTNPSAG